MDALVVTFREGIEAVLVIGVMLAFLKKSGRTALTRPTLVGAGVAVAFSVAVAFALHSAGLNADNPLVEAVLYLVASAGVVTMVVWMLRTGSRMKEGIESRVGGILGRDRGARGLAFALFAFAFFMVVREGVETVLFLAALAVGTTSGWPTLVGALAGLVLAVVYGILFIRGSARLDLRLFFRLTAGVLVLLSLKLLGGSIHEFEEAGLIPMSQTMAHIFDWIATSTAIDWLFLVGLSVPMITPWLKKRSGSRGTKPAVQH
jgi:high-affinity iron transporter